jgi:hypothetical protein
MLRQWAFPVAFIFVSVCGCGIGGSGVTWDPGSVKGSFAAIEASVQDITSQLKEATKRKRGLPRDLGSDSDRIGFSMSVFMKTTEGTPVRADAEDFQKKFNELERLVGTRASTDKVQDAINQVENSLAAIKAKL